jgi:hypothetical protein
MLFDQHYVWLRVVINNLRKMHGLQVAYFNQILKVVIILSGGKLQHTFKTRHLLNTMHIWMMHKRLLTESDKDRFLMIQENMFDMFWEDTVDRISKEDVSSISLNKYLKQVQDISFQMCTHFDEVVTCKNNEMEEIKHYEFVIWDNIYDGQESANKADMKQLAK